MGYYLLRNRVEHNDPSRILLVLRFSTLVRNEERVKPLDFGYDRTGGLIVRGVQTSLQLVKERNLHFKVLNDSW